MKRRIAIALAAGALAVPAATLAQQVLVPVAPPVAVAYPAPPPQTGVSYYCSNPQGWYPTIQGCSAGWVAYSQPQQVVQVAPGVHPARAERGHLLVRESPRLVPEHAALLHCVGALHSDDVRRGGHTVVRDAVLRGGLTADVAASDPASSVYYVGPYRNAPYQSGIMP